jgi:mannosyltransferase OCH1-like enzyme
MINLKKSNKLQKKSIKFLLVYIVIFSFFSSNLFASIDKNDFSKITCAIGKERLILQKKSFDNNYQERIEKFYYKNLNAKASTTLKVPKIIHHIWLTNAEQKREISKENLDRIVLAKTLNNGEGWRHIVWTNDKRLIFNSVNFLEKNGIEVINLEKIEDSLKLWELEKVFIQKGLWGMASDVLRYDILNYMGGVYTDVDFTFVRSVEAELYKYDFLVITQANSSGSGNNFICSKANHPILTWVLRSLLKICNADFFISLNKMDLKNRDNVVDITIILTYDLFVKFFDLNANLDGNVDVIYPPVTKYREYEYEDEDRDDNCLHYINPTDCIMDGMKQFGCSPMSENEVNALIMAKLRLNSREKKFMLICGAEENYYIGYDKAEGSWFPPEQINATDTVAVH